MIGYERIEGNMHCDECNSDKRAHEFYGKNGELLIARLIATNSSHSWRKELCHNCWLEFQKRAFVTVERDRNTFVATCAF